MVAVMIINFIFLAAGCLAQSVHQPSPSQKDSLKKFVQEYVSDPRVDDDETARYSSAFVDLKNDGTEEVIVHLSGRSWCGSGGCVTLILAPEGSGYRVVTEATITRPPIRVLSISSHGWHDLSVWVGGGGIQPYEAELRFDGKTYPSNPTVPPARRLLNKVSGKVVISDATEEIPLYP